MPIDSVPDGWSVWSEEPTTLVLVYRPDVFDSEAFPAPCLPTLYVTRGRRQRRPGRPEPDPDDPWRVTLFLEPEIEGETREYDDRDAALDGALELARAFTAGEIDYRTLYQQPRAAYLDRLDTLTGRET
ncbi:hypothetical protein Hrd1104_05425 [Halorhabdus sp. CBA1104]|uniref:DUF5820 family protein n=1 Tax=Halorhabdus sp. CBA1104 TaxID=1380432 RepID=UPI0012B353A1|nr:DUF5820 family protein [Halorhabdus sp. CBA1104]QGN08192.1 hypothetical protein Hrd1104_05425 [Halorhabdus sp. CBA1104]